MISVWANGKRDYGQPQVVQWLTYCQTGIGENHEMKG